MNKPDISTPAPIELVITSDTFTFHEYCLIREGLFFLEQRPRPRDLRDLLQKLDRLFLPLRRCVRPE